MTIAIVLPDAPEKCMLGEEGGSEEELMYEDYRSSSHRFGVPGGGGGEQLAINEGFKVAGEVEERGRSAAVDDSAAVWCEGLRERRERAGDSGGPDSSERDGLMTRGGGAGRWGRHRLGMFNMLLRCNMPPDTQKVVVFVIMMLLIIINVVLMFLLAFQ
uniref:Uncharacterized protein n=1 Tax=Knipowitschia caucasica TaxID=637954 RepID=A0AAV2JLL9_KNICA